MIARLKSFGAGMVMALSAMAIYAMALGCFIALMLLVISMEEGGATLSNGTVALTEAVVLLSQGVGFDTGSVTVSVIPLLLTVMLVALVAVLAARIGTSGSGFLGGVTLWAAMNWYASQGVDVGLLDAPWALVAKSAAVFACGYAIAAVPRSGVVARLRSRIWDPVSVRVRRAILSGIVMAVLIVAALTVASLAAVIAWIVLDYDAVGALFLMTGMDTGSRIMTSIAAAAWLPNLMIWALSWIAGPGFAIGEVASFSMWIGQSDGLPPLPVFGLMPRPVTVEWVRIALMCVPAATAFVVGLMLIVGRHGLGVASRLRQRIGGDDGDRSADGAAGREPLASAWDTVPLLAYPAASSCLAAALTSLVATAAFALSDGSLGTERLAHVGVDVIAATGAVGHGVALGLLAAWLLTVIGVAAYFGIRWTASRMRDARDTATATVRDADGDGEPAGREPSGERTPAAASAAGTSPGGARSVSSHGASASRTGRAGTSHQDLASSGFATPKENE